MHTKKVLLKLKAILIYSTSQKENIPYKRFSVLAWRKCNDPDTNAALTEGLTKIEPIYFTTREISSFKLLSKGRVVGGKKQPKPS